MSIEIWFGVDFGNGERRARSYDFIEAFIDLNHTDWNTVPNTAALSLLFSDEIKSLTDEQFAFLLCHTGFIPEIYAADSSQETLYTKLVECIVAEWAVRIGFSESVLPTAKGGKEDVTLSDGSHVIVCDAKSYRLGRSQKAPNVKDALKHADISKWLEYYDEEKRIGGLVTFPSQHDWRDGSDFYQYTTDYRSVTPVFFYEHMAFMLLAGIRKDVILAFYSSYREIFPRSLRRVDKNREKYFEALKLNILQKAEKDWDDFQPISQKIIREKVGRTVQLLEKHLVESKRRIELTVDNAMAVEDIKRELIAVKYQHENFNLIRQIGNIKRFRDV